MAKIEMDMSEYESIMDNKKLLQASLDREKELHDQIKKLNDEKIKVLEDAKMKVVKTTIIKKQEDIFQRCDPKENYHLLMNLFRDYNTYSLGTKHDREAAKYIFNNFIENVFSKTSSFSEDSETTFHGLDEIKSEIRDTLKSQLDQDTRNKLQLAEEQNVKIKELIKNNSDLVKENNNLSLQLDLKTKKINDFENIINTSDIHLKEIKDILKDGYTLWNKSELLNKIINIIK